LKAARDLVAQVGFRDAQMAAVAERAGVALGTLYRYFPSKVELMIEVVALVTQREIDVVADVARGSGRAGERLASALWTFASRALRGRKMAHALIVEAVEREIESARLKYLRKLARVFETMVEQGIRDRDFPPQDVRAAGACIVGSLREGLVGPLAGESAATSQERFDQILAVVRFCLRGVAGTDEISVVPAADGSVRVRTIRSARGG
jgi:AcrR family transcriptional regulator